MDRIDLHAADGKKFMFSLDNPWPMSLLAMIDRPLDTEARDPKGNTPSHFKHRNIAEIV